MTIPLVPLKPPPFVLSPAVFSDEDQMTDAEIAERRRIEEENDATRRGLDMRDDEEVEEKLRAMMGEHSAAGYGDEGQEVDQHGNGEVAGEQGMAQVGQMVENMDGFDVEALREITQKVGAVWGAGSW